MVQPQFSSQYETGSCNATITIRHVWMGAIYQRSRGQMLDPDWSERSHEARPGLWLVSCLMKSCWFNPRTAAPHTASIFVGRVIIICAGTWDTGRIFLLPTLKRVFKIKVQFSLFCEMIPTLPHYKFLGIKVIY